MSHWQYLPGFDQTLLKITGAVLPSLYGSWKNTITIQRLCGSPSICLAIDCIFIWEARLLIDITFNKFYVFHQCPKSVSNTCVISNSSECVIVHYHNHHVRTLKLNVLLLVSSRFFTKIRQTRKDSLYAFVKIVTLTKFCSREFPQNPSSVGIPDKQIQVFIWGIYI